jgi:heat shock protein HslJ
MKIAIVSLGIASLSLACATGGGNTAPAPFEKTRWALTSLGPQEIPIPPTQTEPFLVFGGEPGRVVGSGGCNRLAGSYEKDGDKLTFGPLASTKMACATGMETEDAFHQALAKTTTFTINADDELELRDSGNALLATLDVDDDDDD